MTVEEFVNEYNQASDKEKFVKKIIKKDMYVPYIEKIARCENILDFTMYENINNISIFKRNSPMQHAMFTMILIDIYSFIDVDFIDGKWITSFDELNKNACIELMLSSIPDNEYSSWNMILKMMSDDIMINTRDIVSYIETKTASINIAFDEIVNKLEK